MRTDDGAKAMLSFGRRGVGEGSTAFLSYWVRRVPPSDHVFRLDAGSGTSARRRRRSGSGKTRSQLNREQAKAMDNFLLHMQQKVVIYMQASNLHILRSIVRERPDGSPTFRMSLLVEWRRAIAGRGTLDFRLAAPAVCPHLWSRGRANQYSQIVLVLVLVLGLPRVFEDEDENERVKILAAGLDHAVHRKTL
jgi:hypothetical protein